MEYKEFLNQITYSLKAAILDSNISLNELSKRTGIKKSRLILLLNGKDDIYINDSNKDSVKYLFLDDYNNQLKLNKDITDCLYTMDDKTYDLYLHEIELKNKL